VPVSSNVRPRMNLPTDVPKYAVAMEHLDRAIELYLRGDSFYSALHLGGAAEEILNVYAREVDPGALGAMKPAFDQFKEAVLRLFGPCTPKEESETEKWIFDRMTDARNTVKHKKGHRDRVVDFDAKKEAYDVIDRAITTYFQLQSHLSLAYLPSIQVFDERRRQERKNREA